jgi:hypothetical protein
VHHLPFFISIDRLLNMVHLCTTNFVQNFSEKNKISFLGRQYLIINMSSPNMAPRQQCDGRRLTVIQGFARIKIMLSHRLCYFNNESLGFPSLTLV